jgi:hypothetical protein
LEKIDPVFLMEKMENELFLSQINANNQYVEDL